MNDELLQIIKKFNGFHSSMLYDEIINLNKTSNFDKNEFNKFFVLYTLIVGNKLTDLEQLNNFLGKMGAIKDETVENINNDLDKVNKSWIGISHPKKEEIETEQDEIKIYLSVDNNSLHLFANNFLLTCLEHGCSDFDFKINKDESINRRDNVVIYCNGKNFGQYVKIVQEVIAKNNQIEFNNPHLLGIPCDEHIYCGIDFDDGKRSYTDEWCRTILEALNKGKTAEEIVSIIEYVKEQKRPSINNLINISKEPPKKPKHM